MCIYSSVIKHIRSRLALSFGLIFKFRVIARCYDTDKEFNYLDVGCGNHSSAITKEHFPNAKYYGIDIVEDYNNTREDLDNMDGFYKMDLSELKFDDIPDNFFDVINMSHVIEHLQNGDSVLRGLVSKLKEGGIIYIEYPNMKSTKIPYEESYMSFFDDPDHKRIYSLRELYNILLGEGMKFVEGGKRRTLLRLFILPAEAFHHIYTHGYAGGDSFWDVFGIVDYCVFRRKSVNA